VNTSCVLNERMKQVIIAMSKTFFSICLQCLLLISLFFAASILQQQQQYAAAIDLSQSTHITPVHADTSDLLVNNGEVSNPDGTAQNSSIISQKEEQSTAAVKNFQNTFCGVDGTAGNSNTNGYVIEHVLPQSCEMPLGIAVDRDDARVWYVSTKRGVLGSYDLKQNKFDQEHIIPVWNSLKDPTGFSQVWSVKIDNNNNKKQRGGGDIWFTDAQQNAIWRYNKNSQLFEMYKIPGRSASFGTIYPISLEFDSKGNRILFAGTYSHSIWIGDTSKMRNGTSEGISQVPIPIDNITTFNGIDPLYITAGSLAVEDEKNSVWVSVFSYGNKGEIFRYNLQSQSFDKRFDLPPELNSPVGMFVDNNNNNNDNNDSGNLWITNGGSSIFYELNTNNGKIIKYVTSKASPRIFGKGLFQNINEKTNIQDNKSSSNDNISKSAYTLPYWIQKSSDGSLWFNEQEGNKIGRFDPHDTTLIEYWIPSQNKLWGSCSNNNSHVDDSNSGNFNNNNIISNNNTDNQTCGIANVLQFSINTETNSNDNNNGHNNRHSKHENNNHQNIWFTEWSENKIAKVNSDHKLLLPFSVVLSSIPHNKEITIKRGESKEIKVKVISEESSSFSTISGIMNIHMLASGTFTPTGDFGNSTGSFSEEWLSVNAEGDNSNHVVSFTFTPSIDLKPGQYTLMLGAENDAVSYLRAIRLRII
jgi:streptogramin lyase